MVPRVRFELTRPFEHYALNVARLPFRHLGVFYANYTLQVYRGQTSDGQVGADAPSYPLLLPMPLHKTAHAPQRLLYIRERSSIAAAHIPFPTFAKGRPRNYRYLLLNEKLLSEFIRG